MVVDLGDGAVLCSDYLTVVAGLVVFGGGGFGNDGVTTGCRGVWVVVMLVVVVVLEAVAINSFEKMRGKGANAPIKDQTQEFLGIEDKVNKSYSPQNGPTSSGLKPQELQTPMAMQSEFNRKASKIGLGIHQTSRKLSKLTKLAKRTSVFYDPTMEIQELTEVIKQDITALNSAVVDLQLLCNSRNGGGNISSDTTTHSTTVVDDLKNRLMSATKEFKDVLNMRAENLKDDPLAAAVVVDLGDVGVLCSGYLTVVADLVVFGGRGFGNDGVTTGCRGVWVGVMLAVVVVLEAGR
ncbi:unnamed protein product [Fraxinus pennsylvanica]|uniref:Uncharacterized protein n=1 Tax=Fraxinus pennsylvanica TaxID=56036 RepID=A0AAD2E1J5_9LAMI|nr:unnamed protein product [Fraxinus pennsylvanica]